MRWCEENTLSFVKLYLDNEFLWNPAHEWYKNKSKRVIAYSEIIARFKSLTGKSMTIPEVQIKIKNLRSTYTQQVQKILQKSNPDFIYKPSLSWFHEMDRCLKYVHNSKTAASDFNLEMDAQYAIWPSQDNLINSIKNGSTDPQIPLPYSDNEYDITQESVAQIKIEDSSSEHSNIYVQRRKRKKLKKSHYYINTQIENWSNDDEFDLYGKYIASQLRKLELQKAMKVQHEIQNLIVKEANFSSSED